MAAAPTGDDEVLRYLNQLCKPGEDAHRTRTRRYDHAYEVYSANSRPVGLEQWQSRIRAPYGRQVIDTALVNIVGGQPRVIVRPRRPEHELSAKAMQTILDYYVGEDHLVEKQPLFVQQGLIFGPTVAKNHWLYREGERMGRHFHPNPLQPLQPFESQSRVKVVQDDRPTFEPWNVYDAWWDPVGRDPDTCRYIVLRSYASKDELLANQYDPDTGAGLYRNLNDLWDTKPARQRDTTAQESILGGSLNKRKDLIELQEVWHRVNGEVWLTVVGNGKVILRHEQSPYWHGKFPIVIAQPRPDLFELEGTSDTALVDHLQQALWTVQNMRMDNLHLTVMRGITYREGGVTDPNSLVIRPRAKWAVSDHDDIRPFEAQPLPPEAYQEEEQLLGRMQLVTGINPYVSGAQTTGVDQNTATGVTALQEVATRLLRFKAAQLHYKGYQRSFELWGDMTQQFLDTTVAIQLTGSDGKEQWVEVGPQDVVGHFKYTLEGSEESLSRQQERSEAIALLNSFAPLAPLGIVNWKPLLERVALAYDFPNPEVLLNQQPQAPPAAPYPPQQGGVSPNGMVPPPQQPHPASSLLGGQQLNPQILQAIQRGGR